jgi:hypothetical protein
MNPRLLTLAVAVLVLLHSPLCAEEKTSGDDAAPANELREALLGAWALAGGLESKDDPEPGSRMKFWGLKHWVITESDPKTGEIVHHHGGTYTLDGDSYEETIKFAAESTQPLVGRTFKFKIKVEGDTYIQEGIENPFNERWVRLKAESNE